MNTPVNKTVNKTVDTSETSIDHDKLTDGENKFVDGDSEFVDGVDKSICNKGEYVNDKIIHITDLPSVDELMRSEKTHDIEWESDKHIMDIINNMIDSDKCDRPLIRFVRPIKSERVNSIEGTDSDYYIALLQLHGDILDGFRFTSDITDWSVIYIASFCNQHGAEFLQSQFKLIKTPDEYYFNTKCHYIDLNEITVSGGALFIKASKPFQAEARYIIV